MVEGLTQVFAIPAAKGDLEASRAVSQRVELLLRQVDLAERACTSRGVPPGLFARQVTQVRNGLNPRALSANFDHLRQHVLPDVRLAFEWMAFVLPPEDGSPIEPAALKDLIDRLQEARNDPLLDSLPEALRAFTIESLDSLLAAFSNYELTGIAPLQQAVMNIATTAATMDLEAVAEVNDAPAETKSYWQRIKSVLSGAVAATVASGKAAEGLEKVLKLAEQTGLIEYAKKKIGL